ncbi:protein CHLORORESPIRATORY REDUCTION 7, chloroplastic isoform X2 [Nymphaea colorata]|uniref:protein CHLORORESPIRATORY REDUCTION 7, chloroplastic isoform X2 n=1 Tax=Nymphaea colorata TaxID=210225 RepID=UPI00214E8E50|nr:protein CHLORORESPIRATORY REDUCTION 7, chloroplastic isoform X2 [Nymphaea colorata]
MLNQPRVSPSLYPVASFITSYGPCKSKGEMIASTSCFGMPSSKRLSQIPFLISKQGHGVGNGGFSFSRSPKFAGHENHALKNFAVRRRRAYSQTDTYVLMEPGKGEVFVSEEELKSRLKFWLENWPGGTLPPDLSKFKTIEDAVSHLVKSVCELEIDGEVGSVQWYEVRLE